MATSGSVRIVRWLIVLVAIALGGLFVGRGYLTNLNPYDGPSWRDGTHLSPDHRWLTAAIEIERLDGASTVERPPDTARAAEWLAALTAATPPPRGPGTPIARRPIEHGVDALERLHGLDASWEDTTADSVQDAIGLDSGMRRLVEMKPDAFRARQKLMDHLESRRRFDEALAVAEGYEARNSTRQEQMFALFQTIRRSRYLRRLGRLDEAEAVISQVTSTDQAGVLAEAAWVALARGDRTAYAKNMGRLRLQYPNLHWLPESTVRAHWLYASDEEAAKVTAENYGKRLEGEAFVDAMETRDDAGFQRAVRALAATDFAVGGWALHVAGIMQRRGASKRALYLLEHVPASGAVEEAFIDTYAARLAAQLGQPRALAPASSGEFIVGAFSAGNDDALWRAPVPGNADHAASLWTYRLALERSKHEPDPKRIQSAEAYLRSSTGWYGSIGKMIAGQLSPDDLRKLHEKGEGKPIEFHYWSGVRFALDTDYDRACASFMDALLHYRARDAEDRWTVHSLKWLQTRKMSTERLRRSKTPAAPNARDEYTPFW